jgi:SAM-dependent methyltransferase
MAISREYFPWRFWRRPYRIRGSQALSAGEEFKLLSIADQAAEAMFASPKTGKPLLLRDGRLSTQDQSESYPVIGSRVFFIDESAADKCEDMGAAYSAYDSYFEAIKRLLRSTVFATIRSRAAQEAFDAFAEVTSGRFVLGVGGGPVRDFSAVNLNIGAWRNVEIVADAHALPYRNESVDNVSCLAVLEHLNRPDIAVQEMFRVLKPGGYILFETPGLQPYHGYPSHFQNFTLTGHDLLIERFGISKISSGASIGPTSAMVALTAEYVRQYVPAGSVLGPALKGTIGFLLIQLDRILANRRNAFVLCSSAYFYGRKPF